MASDKNFYDNIFWPIRCINQSTVLLQIQN